MTALPDGISSSLFPLTFLVQFCYIKFMSAWFIGTFVLSLEIFEIDLLNGSLIDKIYIYIIIKSLLLVGYRPMLKL